MKLSQATKKLSLTTIYGFNRDTDKWDKLPFKVSYAPDGRFIGRSVSFYDRRVLITPEVIPDRYATVKLGLTDSEILMVYAGQENINRDETYLFSYTLFNVMGFAVIKRLVKTTTASGVGGKSVDSIVGAFPVAMEKGFAGPAHDMAAGFYNTRVSCYIPSYADIRVSDTLEFGNEVYTIDESIPELQLRFLQLTKR
jgi:hypothetical protein